MVSHYVNMHEYMPPKEFVEAIMAGPLPGCDEYTKAVRPFRGLAVW
jgi:hypothetical protein